MAIINQTASIDDLYNRFDALRQQPKMPPVMSQGIGPLFMNQGGNVAGNLSAGNVADAIGTGLSIADLLGVLGKFSGISLPFSAGKAIFNLFTGRSLLPFGIGSLFDDGGDPRGLTEAAKTGAARITPVTRQDLAAPGGDGFDDSPGSGLSAEDIGESDPGIF